MIEETNPAGQPVPASPRGQRSRRRYRTGDEALDTRIAEIVSASGYAEDADLLAEMIASCFRLAKYRSDRGDMNLVNAALK